MPPAPHPTRGRTVAAVLGTAAVAVLVLLPDALGVDRWLPFAVFAAMRPTLVVAVAGLVVVAAVAGVVGSLRPRTRRGGQPARSRRWWCLAVVATVTVLAGGPLLGRTVADPPPAPGGTDLTLLSLNAFEGKADPDALAAVIDRLRPDLVVLPEAGERFRARIAARTPDYRSWTNVPPGARDVRGIVVLAAPRAGDVRARLLDEGARYPWAEVTGGLLGPARLVAVHVVSIVPSWISSWPGELGRLGPRCRSGTPTLIVGDLNATEDHSAFRSGTAGCTDAADARGRGLTATWRSTWPRWLGAQIDHTLTAGGPAAREVEVVDVPRTDHRGLWTRVRF